MKRNNTRILILLLTTLLLFSSCIQPDLEETTTEPIEQGDVDKTVIGSYQTMQYQYLTNVNISWLTTNLNPSYLVLANKSHDLGKHYSPSPLTVLTCSVLQPSRTYELESRAAQALYAMLAEMQAAGVSDIMVASAYRSYEYQRSVYDSYIQQEMTYISDEAHIVFGEAYIKANYLDKKIFKLSLEDAHTVVQSYSALPGQSEHQTGLCVDFATKSEDEPLTQAFENTQAFAWLAKNAYKFGFILRYPKGMESITGYTYEPWHYRFVGREAATDIYVGNMTLEQYLELIK